MFKVEHIKVIRTKGSGVGGFSNGIFNLGLGERGEISINRMGLAEFTDKFAGIFVGLMGRNRGELFYKGVGDI